MGLFEEDFAENLTYLISYSPPMTLPPHPLMSPGALIALTGVARSGKSATSALIASLRPGTVEFAFAAALKRQAAAAFGVAVEDIEAQKSVWRPLLQAWGLLRRDLDGSAYWVDKIAPAVSQARSLGHVAVISDLRYASEAAWVREQGGVLVRVVRPHLGESAPPHVSETEQLGIAVDFTVEACNLVELRLEVERLLKKLNI